MNIINASIVIPINSANCFSLDEVDGPCDRSLVNIARWLLEFVAKLVDSAQACKLIMQSNFYTICFSLSRATVNYNGTEARDMKKCARLF